MLIKLARRLSAAIIISLLLVLALGLYLRANYINPVLMYHYVIEDKALAKKDKRVITTTTFEKQMRFLKTNKYNVITLEEFARLLKEKKEISRNTVVITFDDGHLDNYQNAYPILKKYNLPATMFVIVDRLSQPNFMTRKQIKEMSDSGLVTIGSHTLTEAYLPKVEEKDRLKREIFDSKKKLEAILDKPVNCFSYPIGGFNKEIRQMAIDAGYGVAVSTSPGFRYPNDDPFVIKRIKISESSNNSFIFWFEISGLYKHILELRKDNKY
ncbi:MAG: polysaccharide deacetylase family protein [Candidatus Omnitrophica bacterium]|nr:polysaccharide deacetylase family protein [Candidatus Omnitrophota bacterium]